MSGIVLFTLCFSCFALGLAIAVALRAGARVDSELWKSQIAINESVRRVGNCQQESLRLQDEMIDSLLRRIAALEARPEPMWGREGE